MVTLFIQLILLKKLAFLNFASRNFNKFFFIFYDCLSLYENVATLYTKIKKKCCVYYT